MMETWLNKQTKSHWGRTSPAWVVLVYPGSWSCSLTVTNWDVMKFQRSRRSGEVVKLLLHSVSSPQSSSETGLCSGHCVTQPWCQRSPICSCFASLTPLITHGNGNGTDSVAGYITSILAFSPQGNYHWFQGCFFLYWEGVHEILCILSSDLAFVLCAFLQRFIKKLEHSWKALVYDGVSKHRVLPVALPDGSLMHIPKDRRWWNVNWCVHFLFFQDTVSVHRPGFYANRFLKFMSTRVFRKTQSKPTDCF